MTGRVTGTAGMGCLGLALVLAAQFAGAQETSKPEPPPAQEPGAGAQVRTGSGLGEGSASRMMTLLGDHQFLEMEKILGDPAHADPDAPVAVLTEAQRQLFRGILDNRENKPADSIQLLEPLVAKLDAEPTQAPLPEEKLLRKTLAEDYLRTGDLAKAAQAYQRYDARLGASLSPEEKDEIELPLKLLPLAASHPPMTVEYGVAFSLPYDRDELGLTDVPVFVDAMSHDWMLDPTAPLNLICRSTAKEVGLKVSEAAVTVHTITGRPMQVHATIIPRFTLGTVTYRNMTAFVFEDADYYFPKAKYQVRGVLGYPAVSALGSLTIRSNARIDVQPGPKGKRLETGARFFLDGDQVIVALGKRGEERMFAVDAGGQQTYLTSRYFAEHSGDFADKKMQLLPVPGAPGKPPAPAYVAESLNLLVGETPMSFHYTQVLTQPQGSSAIDDTYGTLGMDALDELETYTFDYRTMRFGVTTQ